MSTKKRTDKATNETVRFGAVMSTSELVERFGEANAEYIKGYSGIDHETGKKFAKGLKEISEHKVNAQYAEQNIKQQAGYSAEIAATSRDNAQAIIDRSKVRVSRSDDLSEYGRNHNVVDRVQLIDGQIIDGSQAQMKFVGNRNELFRKITKENGEFARYRGVKLELPSEQYEGAAQHCNEMAEKLRLNASEAEKKGNLKVASELRKQAKNYETLAKNVTDSGLTTEQAIFYRKYPKLATAIDIARTSHQAGVKGAQYGAVIGGSISIIKNIFAILQDEKEADQAVIDAAIDSTQAAALGYGTAFTGAAIKAGMKQSSKETIRNLSNTNIPVLVMNTCLSLAGLVKSYVKGDISESQFLYAVGERGAGMLSGGMMAALGQAAVPIPFVGAAVGGMVGYALSVMFYQSALSSAISVEASRVELARVRAIERAARNRIAQERANFELFVKTELSSFYQETQILFDSLNDKELMDINQITLVVNNYAHLLGKELQFETQSEFDDFMSSDDAFLL